MISCPSKPLADVSTAFRLRPAASHGLMAHVTDVPNHFVRDWGKLVWFSLQGFHSRCHRTRQSTQHMQTWLEKSNNPANCSYSSGLFRHQIQESSLLTRQRVFATNISLFFCKYNCVSQIICLPLTYPFSIKQYIRVVILTLHLFIQFGVPSHIFFFFITYNPSDDCVE